MDKAESLMLGALVFLGYYELAAGLQVPSDFGGFPVTQGMKAYSQ